MMTRTEMNMLTERFAEVTGKQNDSVMNLLDAQNI